MPTNSKQHQMIEAAWKGHIEDVKTLIEDDTVAINGTDSNGMTALHHCCTTKHYDIITFLLDQGADVEAKMNFIKAWQSLPDYGVSLFVVRFHGEKREELLGVAFNRIMRMSLQNGDHIKTWRFNTIKV